jgi:hypothetical protein
VLSSETIGGHGFDHAWDLSFGGVATTGSQITVVNDGTKAVGALIRLIGPVITPKLVSDTAGKTLQFNLTAGTSLDAIDIDLNKRTVKLNGASRRGTVADENGWFKLLPGTNVIRYQAASATVVPLNGTFQNGYF